MKTIMKNYESPCTFICRVEHTQALMLGSKTGVNDYTQGNGSGSDSDTEVVIHNDPISQGGEIAPARYDAWATWDDMGWE